MPFAHTTVENTLGNQRDAFEKHLAALRAEQAAKVAAIGKVDAGAIVKSTRRDAWLVISADVGGRGMWRLTRFDLDGFSGHDLYNDKEAAINEAAQDDYTVRDDGALDRIGLTPRFQRGIEYAGLIRKFGANPTQAFYDAVAALNARFDVLIRESSVEMA